MSGINRRLSLAMDYAFKSTVCKFPPVRIGIEVTNNCNLRCSMCIRNNMTRKVGNMDMSIFEKIIDDGKQYLDFVGLQDVGEPLLNKNIFRMIEYCNTNNVRTLFSTNATMLNDEVVDSLLNSGIDYIIFAFDGATKETYEKIRVGANYEKVVDNIRNFLRKKTKRRAKVFCTLQCIYMQETENEIKEFRKMWSIPGVDAIRIRQITHGVDGYDSGQKKFSNINYKLPCYWLWSDPYIKWDGTMVPCCQDANAIYPLGNIKEHTISELWNNEKMHHLREMHIKGKYDSVLLCKGCNMYKPTVPLVLGSSFFNTFALQKLVPRVETILCKLRY